MNPISIHGLTSHQVDLLNLMWQFEELEDIEAWKETLDSITQHQVELLMRMVVLAATDELVVEDMSDAREYLQKFRL